MHRLSDPLGWMQSLCSLFFPRRCAICSRVLESWEEGICLDCLADLPRTDYHLNPENPVMDLLWGQATLEKATAYLAPEKATAYLFFRKGEKTQRLIHLMKYYGRKDICRLMGRQMAEDLGHSDFFEGIDMVIPVPMHHRKERKRGYNQATELARGLTEVTGLELVTDAIIKATQTDSQARQGGSLRWQNVKDSFRIARPDRIAGQHVLLVDDVLTTGSTVTACAQQILAVEATKVSVLVLATGKRHEYTSYLTSIATT